MNKDDSFTMTPPSKARTKAETAVDDWQKSNQSPPPNDAAAAVQAYGQRAAPEAPPEPAKRVTISLPQELHQRVRIGCIRGDTTIAEVVREFLDRKFPRDV